MDPYARDTVGDNTTDTALRRVMNSIPGLRQQLPEKLDNFGNPKSNGGSAYDRWMNSFVRPGAINSYQAPEMYQALDELYARTGEEKVIPDRKPPNSFSFGGVKIEMTGDEKRQYQKVYGQTAEDLYTSILMDDDFKDLSDSERTWLLEQAEQYATYQAKKTIADARGEEYKNDSWDKVDALADAGGDPLDYLYSRQAFKSAIKEKDFDAVDALLADMGKHDDVVTEALLADVTRLDDMQEAHKAGIGYEDWSKAYDMYKEVKDRKESAQQQAEDIARYLTESGLSRAQQNLLRDQFRYYSMIGANTDKYNAMTAAGISPEKADKVTSIMAELKPDADHASVTQNQKINAISGANLTEAEKWAVLKIYATDACYKKAMEAKAAGKSFFQWALEYTSGK